MSEYWNNQTRGFNSGLNNISTALYQIPRMRAEAARSAAMRQEALARTGLIGTQTEKTATETEGLRRSQVSDMELSEGLQKVQANNGDTNAWSKVFHALGNKFKNPAEGALALQRLSTLQQAMTGSTNYDQMAAMGGDSDKIANNIRDNQEKANRPMNITGSVFDPTTKSIVANAPKSLPQGNVLVGETNTPPMGIIAKGFPPKVPIGSEGRTTIRQVVNPARVVGGELNTNQPPYLSLTNTMSPISSILQGGGQAESLSTNQNQNEVKRMTKDGRTAIFDASTKQFLRYADN